MSDDLAAQRAEVRALKAAKIRMIDRTLEGEPAEAAYIGVCGVAAVDAVQDMTGFRERSGYHDSEIGAVEQVRYIAAEDPQAFIANHMKGFYGGSFRVSGHKVWLFGKV